MGAAVLEGRVKTSSAEFYVESARGLTTYDSLAPGATPCPGNRKHSVDIGGDFSELVGNSGQYFKQNQSSLT